MMSSMFPRLATLALLSVASICLNSCGNDSDIPIMAGNTLAASQKGEKLYLKAKAIDDAGKTKKAIKSYDKMATAYPFSPSAATARFRQAQLQEAKGEPLAAFETYDKFLTSFPGSALYTPADSRLIAISQAAASGGIKNSLMGIKSRISNDKVIEMLGKVRDQAPKSQSAAKAQYSIGELYEANKKSKEATAAYRQLVRDHPNNSLAPEALFRIGQILLNDANAGNQNQANLDLAREAFNDYLIQYPGHSRNAEVRKLIADLSLRDYQRSFDIAEFYLKTGKTESAKIYYREVLKRSSSGSIYDRARARLNELGE